MAQIFHPSTNTLSKVTIFGAVFVIGAAAWGLSAINRSPWITEAQVAREQPVPFSHKHHVDGLGIDCRYCHTSVEESAFAGIPPTKTCMTCHSQVWRDAPILEPVRQSYASDRSIPWLRVHDLPDFAYFNHSIHVKKGIGCETCHGRVDLMPLVWREHSLNMEWCLECHRNPGAFVRPRAEVFTMGLEERADRAREDGGSTTAAPRDPRTSEDLVREYDIKSLTNCSICHR